jgi:hypothetical protein
MTLVELKPRWFATERGRHGQGLTFLCPHCRTVRLAVAFANPLDGYPPDALTGTSSYIIRHVHYTRKFDVPPGGPYWTRTGRTFATLTLTPSVDASASGHWHGYITAGTIR